MDHPGFIAVRGLERDEHQLRENLLFTHRGLSGPAILQISSYWNPGDHIIINLMPNENTYTLLINEKKYRKQILLRTCLIEKLPKAFVIEIQTLWWKDLAEKPLAEISDKKLKFIGDKINAWVLKPSATEKSKKIPSIYPKGRVLRPFGGQVHLMFLYYLYKSFQGPQREWGL